MKASVDDPLELEQRVRPLADSGPVILVQTDTFFSCPNGRLKLRTFADGTGELIQYAREDSRGPKLSDYQRTPIPNPQELTDILGTALGIRGVVRKTRKLYLIGQTRVHLDTVEELGSFLELEVVLRPEQTVEQGTAIASDLMTRLGVTDADLIDSAYIDLLER